ncbi:MAG: hypothetical protein K0S74_406 [Chlamydiales bacterium]|jgi:hypothetical protein|nr:hypothetical protein [Chlamydiales bacterium]
MSDIYSISNSDLPKKVKPFASHKKNGVDRQLKAEDSTNSCIEDTVVISAESSAASSAANKLRQWVEMAKTMELPKDLKVDDFSEEEYLEGKSDEGNIDRVKERIATGFYEKNREEVLDTLAKKLFVPVK